MCQMSEVCQTHTSAVSQSFALRTNRRRGAAFLGWFSRQLENRNHVAYLDTAHNDESSVYRNVFLNFALTALKIPVYFEAEEPLSEKRSRAVFGTSVVLYVGIFPNVLQRLYRPRWRTHMQRDERGSGMPPVMMYKRSISAWTGWISSSESIDLLPLHGLISSLAQRGMAEALQYQVAQSRLGLVLSLLRSSLSGKRFRGKEKKHSGIIGAVLAAVSRCLRERKH